VVFYAFLITIFDLAATLLEEVTFGSRLHCLLMM
jgi:hypothetical protein